MSDYVSRLKADTSQHDKAMEDSAKKVSDYKKQTDQASASVQNLTQKTSKSTSELMKEMASMENLGRSTSNYKKQLGSLQRQIADLTVNYRQMNDAEKQSSLGKEVAAKIDELKQKAAEYKDAIADVNAEITHMASDTAGWDAAKQGINLVSSAMQTFISVTGLSEKESAKLLAVMNKVKLAEQAANTAINIGNALQKQSGLMQGIKALQTKAATAATNAQTAATGRATVAQKIFNAVAKANPYVLLATAIIGVGAALVAFSKKSNEAAEAQKKLNEQLKKSKEAAAEPLAKFALLQSQYKSLKSTAEQTKWIKDNQKEFEELGISINNINDADDVFIKKAAKVIEAMKLRAEAAAMMQVYQEGYAEAYKKSLELEAGRKNAFQGGGSIKSEWKDAGLVSGVDYNNFSGTFGAATGGPYNYNNYQLTPEGVAKLQAYFKQLGENNTQAYINGHQGMVDEMTAKIAAAEKLESEVGHFNKNGGSGSGKDNKPDWQSGSLGELKSQLSELENQRVNLQLSDEAAAKLQQDIADLQAKIEAEEIRLGIKVKEDEVAKSLAKAVDGAKKALESGSKETTAIIEPVKMFDSTLQTAEDTFRDNNDLLKNYNSTLQQLAGSLASLKAAQDALNQAGGPDQSSWTDDARKAYADLEAKIAELTAQYQDTIKKAAELTETQKGLNDEIKKQNKIVAKNDIYGGIKSAWSVTKGWADSLVDITEKWDEMSEGEQFTAIVESIFSTIDAFKSLSETITLMNNAFILLGRTQQTNAAISTTTTAQEVSNEETKQQKDITGIGLKIFKSGINAVEGGTSTGFPAMLVAIPVAIAAVVAAIASAKSLKGSFAEGGIISGPTSLGDYNIARVNSGEMILNGSQQARLFNMIKNGGIGGGRIETTTKTKIEGSDLLLISKNYMKKMDKI